MLESILTISVTGLVAGFILSMPIAGPISILVTSNALKGRLRYCVLVGIGASIADFAYVFIAVFGLTKLYTFYKPAIPYIFAIGSVYFIYMGYKIIRTTIDIENLEDKTHLTEKIQKKGKGAFLTGFLINFLNPTLFIGVLTSSFFVISLIAALGFHTGGLAGKMNQNLSEINNIEGKRIDTSQVLSISHFDSLKNLKRSDQQPEQLSYPHYFHFLISTCYAFFLSLGSIVWLWLLSVIIIRFRHHINVKIVSGFIKSLGVILCFFGLFFIYLSLRIFFPL
jgi:threonine/homoserine/homoserine lactone efflux protein